MDARTDTKTLTDALAVLNRYAGSGKGLTPPQDWAELRVNDGGGSLTVRRWARKTGTDVTATIEANGGTSGTAHVDATALAAAVKGLTGPIALALADTERGPRLTITGDGGSAELRTENGADFPQPPTFDWYAFVTVPTSKRDALASVVKAAAKGSDARAVLTGVFFDADAGEAAATDTYRLHVASLGKRNVARSAIVPSDVLRIALATAPASFVIDADDTGKRFRVAYTAEKGPKRSRRYVHVTATGHAIEGPFPNYATLVPNAEDVSATWNVRDAAGTADVLRTFANTRNTPAILAAAGSAVSVTASDAEGTRDALVPIVPDGDTIGGAPSIAFNAAFLADAIGHVGDGGTIRLRDPMRGALAEAEDRYALLMPMRVA